MLVEKSGVLTIIFSTIDRSRVGYRLEQPLYWKSVSTGVAIGKIGAASIYTRSSTSRQGCHRIDIKITKNQKTVLHPIGAAIRKTRHLADAAIYTSSNFPIGSESVPISEVQVLRRSRDAEVSDVLGATD